METTGERPIKKIQAPSGACAVEIGYLAMAKPVANLSEITGEDLTDVLPNTQFKIACGVTDCSVNVVVTMVGRQDKIFGTPNLYTDLGQECLLQQRTLANQ